MKSKLILGSLAGLAVVGTLAFTPLAANAETALRQVGYGNGAGVHDGTGAQNGSANGYQASLETRAKAVNMTTAQLTEALKTKTMDQIMAEKNISTDAYQAKMREVSTVRWESKGLSAEEVQKRVEWQQNRQATTTHDGANHEQGGYGRQNR